MKNKVPAMRERGSLTVEFIVTTPLLLVLLFGLFVLNERFDWQQDVAIRNWLQGIALQPQSAQVDFAEDRVRWAEGWRQGEEDGFASISKLEGIIADVGLRIWQPLHTAIYLGERDLSKVIQARLTSPPASLLRNGFYKLQRLADFSSHTDQSAVASVVVTAHDAVFHPRPYPWPFLAGILLGERTRSVWTWTANPHGPSVWSLRPLPGNFTTECPMNWVVGDNCRTATFFFAVVTTVGVSSAVANAVKTIFTGGEYLAAQKAANESLKVATQSAVHVLVDGAKAKAQEVIAGSLDHLLIAMPESFAEPLSKLAAVQVPQ